MPALCAWTVVAAVATAVSVLELAEGWSDLHLFHVQCECIYRDRKVVNISWQDAFDGTTILYYDSSNKTFVATQSIAQAEVDKRNADPDYIESVPRRLESLCEQIQQIATTSNDTMEKMVFSAPTFTRTFVQRNAGRNDLVCLVKNFFPREITVSWVRNGAVTVNRPVRNRILPQRDGTFQARSVLSLNGDVDASYSCQVEHATISGKLSVPLEWNSNAENEALIIIGAVLGIVGLSAAAVTGILYHCGFNRCNQFEIQAKVKFTNRAGPCRSNPCHASGRSSASDTSDSSGSSADGLTKTSA